MDIKAVLDYIEGHREEMVSTLIEFCRIPALGPTSDGEGELKKAEWLQRKLESFGFEVERHDAKDDRVPSGVRPNLVVRLGRGKERLWVLSHLDIVPPGDLTKWPCDPFNPIVKDGKVFGRGVEDNGQACIASLFALRAIRDRGLEPTRQLIFTWVSDEETGSYYGVQHLIREGLLQNDDWALVPDWGMVSGSAIEVAEKNILWLKFTILGKQVHGSIPHKGINAHRAGADLICRIDKALHQRYKARDKLFIPPFSTFEPTKKDSNVPNVNTVPGLDVFYFDCRVIPRYRNKDIIKTVREQVKAIERLHHVKIDVEAVQDESSPPLSPKSELVSTLSKAIKRVRGRQVQIMGIGGGTVAAYFRRAGVDTVVYCSGEETGHSTGEYCRIDNLVTDSKVFATLALTS